MAVHPGHEEAAVAAAAGHDAVAVGPALRAQPVGGGLDVLQLQLALAADEAVAERVAEAAGAMVVDLHDDTAGVGGQAAFARLGRRKDVRVPAPAEAVAGRGKGAAVDHVQRRMFFLGIEARREREPHLHRVAQRARDLHLAHLAQGHTGQHFVVEALQAARRATQRPRPDLGRVPGRVGQPQQRVARGVEALHPAAGLLEHGLGGVQRQAPQVAAAAVLGGKAQALAVGRPEQPAVDVVVPAGAQRLERAIGRHQGGPRQRRVHGARVRGQAGQPAAVG